MSEYCQLTSLCSKCLYLLAKVCASCSVLQTGVQCIIAPSPHIRQRDYLALLGVVAALQLPDACLPKAGVGTNPRGIALPSCFCSIGVDHSFVCFFRQFWNRKSSCCPSWPAERLHEVSYVVAAGQFLWSSVASLPGTLQDHLYLLNAGC